MIYHEIFTRAHSHRKNVQQSRLKTSAFKSENLALFQKDLQRKAGKNVGSNGTKRYVVFAWPGFQLLWQLIRQLTLLLLLEEQLLGLSQARVHPAVQLGQKFRHSCSWVLQIWAHVFLCHFRTLLLCCLAMCGHNRAMVRKADELSARPC